ncbi:hypothetical protein LAZ67_8003177 [Cordylochernes scorpioides]|uniref:Uncharacterized protein n=1 Tax=Cordylochernes scorpioides TaxID=51811 RepID=A0ABY6KRX1_9ARAC|nr:hypothetical protein LAZ67_8003177 [Cordylochernes scorpioides]
MAFGMAVNFSRSDFWKTGHFPHFRSVSSAVSKRQQISTAARPAGSRALALVERWKLCRANVGCRELAESGKHTKARPKVYCSKDGEQLVYEGDLHSDDISGASPWERWGSAAPNNSLLVRRMSNGHTFLRAYVMIEETLGIPKTTVDRNMREHLGLRKLSARWVPKLLTPDQKAVRRKLSSDNLALFEANTEEFVNRFVTMDETWAHHFTPESKQQSLQWRHSGSPPPKKAKTVPSTGKVMVLSNRFIRDFRAPIMPWERNSSVFLEYQWQADLALKEMATSDMRNRRHWQADLAPEEMAASDMRKRCHEPLQDSRQDYHNEGDHNEEGKDCPDRKEPRSKMEEQTNPSNDTAEQTIPKQETTLEEEETAPPQDTSADPLTQIADALSKLLVARSPREIDVSPYDGTFEAQSFFDNFDAQADRTELTYTDRLRKLPCYLQGKPLQYFRSLRLDRLYYIEARQRLIDLFPATTEASFARFLAIKMTPQMSLENYYQNKTVMGMKLDLPADILIESLTDGLPVADQRLVATVQPNTIKEWFDLVSRITQCATSAVNQRQVDKAPHPTYHNPPPRYNSQRPSRVTYTVTPPPSPCKYCNAMHWHSQCERRFPRDQTRPVYSARPHTTTVPKRGTHTQPKVQPPSHVPQVQAASPDDSASPASSSTVRKQVEVERFSHSQQNDSSHRQQKQATQLKWTPVAAASD